MLSYAAIDLIMSLYLIIFFDSTKKTQFHIKNSFIFELN